MMIYLQQFINALSLGSIYALIALGYTMVYGIVMLINFAHGDVLMVGVYVGYFVLASFGNSPLSILFAFILSMFFSAILGILIERFAYRPLRKAPRLNSLITAIAVSIFLQNGMRILPFVGPNPREFKGISSKILTFASLQISNVQLIIILTATILMIALYFIIVHTKIGKAMRATSFDMEVAGLMGISVNGTIAFTFALGSVLAAVAGILYASAYPQIAPTMGAMPGLKAFIAAVLGGIGSIPGAVLGSFILALAETFTKGFLSSQFADAISFAILILILLVKPSGILGKKINVKV